MPLSIAVTAPEGALALIRLRIALASARLPDGQKPPDCDLATDLFGGRSRAFAEKHGIRPNPLPSELKTKKDGPASEPFVIRFPLARTDRSARST